MRKFQTNKTRWLCGLLSGKTAVLLVSVAAILTDSLVYLLCLYPKWIERDFHLLSPSHISLMYSRMVGVVVSAVGILSGVLLMIGSRCEIRFTYVVFIVCTGLVILYSYFAAFMALFKVLILTQEKGDLHRRKHFSETGIFICTTFLNFYFAFVVSRS